MADHQRTPSHDPGPAGNGHGRRRLYRGQPHLRSTLVLDKETAEVQTLTTFLDQSAGQRLRSWLRFAHTGEFYGVGGQTVAGIASCSAVMLVLTGLSLSIRRFLAWIGQRRPTRTERAEHGPLAINGLLFRVLLGGTGGQLLQLST